MFGSAAAFFASSDIVMPVVKCSADVGGQRITKCESSGCLEEAEANGFCGEHGGACLSEELAQYQGNLILEEPAASGQPEGHLQHTQCSQPGLKPSATETATSSAVEETKSSPDTRDQDANTLTSTATNCNDAGRGPDDVGIYCMTEDEYVEHLLGLNQLRRQCVRAGRVRKARAGSSQCIEHSCLQTWGVIPAMPDPSTARIRHDSKRENAGVDLCSSADSNEGDYAVQILSLSQPKKQCVRAKSKYSRVERLVCIENGDVPRRKRANSMKTIPGGLCALPNCGKVAEYGGLCYGHSIGWKLNK